MLTCDKYDNNKTKKCFFDFLCRFTDCQNLIKDKLSLFLIIMLIFVVLYKRGPKYFHSSLGVVVRCCYAGSLTEIDGYNPRMLTWTKIMGLNRVINNVRKVKTLPLFNIYSVEGTKEIC